jgi:hypothetical protein
MQLLTKQQVLRCWPDIAGMQFPRLNSKRRIVINFPASVWAVNGFRTITITRAAANTPDGSPLYRCDFDRETVKAGN